MAESDPTKTHAVQALLAVPHEARDGAWLQRFYAAVPDASFASTPEQHLVGPDAFPYFVLLSPTPGQPFTPFSISEILTHCTDHGLGIVVDPERPHPSWVFPYGNLWSLRAHGSLAGDPADEPGENAGTNVVSQAREILVGAPSEAFLPPWARKELRSYLIDAVGLADPQVCLVIDATLKPSQNLVFNLFTDDPPLKMPHATVMERLGWYLPPGRGLLSFARGTLNPSGFLPL